MSSPAREATCFYSQKVGHFAKVYHKRKISTLTNQTGADETGKVTASVQVQPHSTIATVTNNVLSSLATSVATVTINGIKVKALFDSCSSESFVHSRLVETAKLPKFERFDSVSMASSDCTVDITHYTTADVLFQGQKYDNVRFGVLYSLCNDVIFGQDFQAQHKSITFDYGGDKPSLTFCGLTTLNIPPVEPFKNLSSDCHPLSRSLAITATMIKRLLTKNAGVC